ncbi:MAG TPA: class I SAM-dependent methyltransferase [Gammaproteobacteria bacterium]|nr:class I SAM-dependent methyltransferase [Gammaproteobacteria bacterium]
MNNAEQVRLDTIALDPKYAEGPNESMVEYSFEVFSRYLEDGPTLEMGPAEGVMTRHLVEAGYPLTVVEASGRFCNDLKARHPGIHVVQSLFETFSPAQKFTNIILGHVLEHVENPAAILARVKEWLAEDGRILAAVPNSRSLHRQVGVLLGQLPIESALNEADLQHGHRRVYDPESFRHEFMVAGLDIRVFGGYWLKPVSNAQIEEHWTREMISAFMQLGERYPDIAAEIYVIAGNP